MLELERPSSVRRPMFVRLVAAIGFVLALAKLESLDEGESGTIDGPNAVGFEV
jgi:hypothetical protein